MNAKRVELKRFQEENLEEWSEFVATCDEAWVFHTPAYIRSFPYDFSFSIRIDGCIQGICVMGRVPCRGGAYFVGPGGALSEEAKKPEVYNLLTKKIKSLASSVGCQRVEFTLSPMAPANTNKKFSDSLLHDCGFTEGGRWWRSWENLPGYFSVIDLHLEFDEIVRRFSRFNRVRVARCNELGLKVAVETGEAANKQSWEDFVRIHRLTYLRTNGEPFSDERLESLFHVVQAGHLMLLRVLDDGACITCLLLATDKGGSFYLAGGAVDTARQNGVMVWAHSEAIRWLKEKGYKYYCLGFTISSLEGTPIGSIGDSKKRFGGERWPMLCGDLILRPFSFFTLQVLPELVDTYIRK